MNTHETNNAKRAEIARLVTDAIGKGWTVADLALACFVTNATIRAWGKGANMGTNTIRAWLAAVPPRATPEGRAALIARIESGARELAKQLEWAQRAIPADRGGHYRERARDLSARIGERESRILQIQGER